MENIKLSCEYCNVSIEYFGKADPLLKSAWEAEHVGCKDFKYITKIKINNKGGVKLWI
jgi:hypothetical protein